MYRGQTEISDWWNITLHMKRNVQGQTGISHWQIHYITHERECECTGTDITDITYHRRDNLQCWFCTQTNFELWLWLTDKARLWILELLLSQLKTRNYSYWYHRKLQPANKTGRFIWPPLFVFDMFCNLKLFWFCSKFVTSSWEQYFS